MLGLDLSTWQWILFVIDYSIKFVVIGIIPENRKPSSANAWLLVILLIPYLGLPLYFFLGSTFLNRRRHRIQERAADAVQDVHSSIPDFPKGTTLSDEKISMITLNRTLTGYPALDGRVLALWADYDKAMMRLASAIDDAEHYVHVEMYAQAWDQTTHIVFEALERAVARGVKVRVLFDQIGSQKYPGFKDFKKRLTAAGIEWHQALPIQLLRGRFRRPDLRNHRKQVIIDDRVGFMGSINLIDRSYLMPGHVKKGRQWVDALVEVTGPIVASFESMFAVDWYTESGEVIELVPPHDPDPDAAEPSTLQLIPSGPGYQTEPNLRMFNTLIHHARRRLVLCSPYFVPDDSMLEAITTACYRGVRVDLLVGEKADQFMVDHAQSAYYQQLLEAGVHIWQFPAPYILHTKFAIADPAEPTDASDSSSEHPNCVAIMGSSNMDMRSFSLNFENSLFIARGPLLDDLMALSRSYFHVSKQLTLEEWSSRPWTRRYIDNVMKLTSAVQ
ncbi:cardiolipin synthase [Corynebacterium aquatimens]|uniref:Cardiolipin synthase n=1 Tax=Corynebacterium aquatimens TaxID=1190508 RepID=A0A931GU37_9CORY|nr:cardiolipin synthase [Corynebacterium aquatimens]MBG6122385.1 cardiolipin synthase [Corynebacterium aquatimens]WJY65072.1 Cardiolipin synthase [Corynebacterium aquatimens]